MAKRFKIAESEGLERSYSYEVSNDYPLGSFTDEDLPPELYEELAALG